jgi:hypothetical protein
LWLFSVHFGLCLVLRSERQETHNHFLVADIASEVAALGRLFEKENGTGRSHEL